MMVFHTLCLALNSAAVDQCPEGESVSEGEEQRKIREVQAIQVKQLIRTPKDKVRQLAVTGEGEDLLRTDRTADQILYGTFLLIYFIHLQVRTENTDVQQQRENLCQKLEALRATGHSAQSILFIFSE
jgi:hypothetical protein